MKQNKFLQEGLAGAQLHRQASLHQRILVVDDDLMIRRLNSKALTGSGYEVNAAEDGADAWEALQLENYDLMVTDNDMPNVTGVELIQKLQEARMNLPVIMATGTVPQDHLDRHPWLKINAVLVKPFSFDVLLETVKNVLHAHAWKTCMP
jgi:DNA-binding response OmpR family regulator